MTGHSHAAHRGPRGLEVREGETAEEFWQDFYRSRGQVWSGRPNVRLVEVARDLEPGTALDLGCGEGGDAVWLAGRGWRVTAVDVAPAALERVREHAAQAGVAVVTERHDLAQSFPEGSFDLVSACFFQSPLELPREEVLRRAAAAVAPGGMLLVVDHGSAPSWSWAHAEMSFPTPQELLDSLDLPTGRWRPERVESLEREATGPEGETGVVLDTVVAVRRTG